MTHSAISQLEPSPIDRLVMNADSALQTLFGRPRTTERVYPAQSIEDAELTDEQKINAGRLMRVNHVGEVCAQALYQSQALTARKVEIREKMQRSSMEENDHLDWCEKRITEVGGRKSLLNPLWYAGSFAIGTVAGLAGDRWSLGFVAETERQVVKHLSDHLDRLPTEDVRSRVIVAQMKIDEGEHATAAINAGASELPEPIKKGMQVMSKVMTRTVHWL